MKENIIIIGTSEFSEYVLKCIQKDEAANVIAFAVNKEYIKAEKYNELPVVPLEKLDSRYDMEAISVLITIGYNRMNEGREKMYHYCKEKGYKVYTFISPRAYVDCDLEAIGEGSIIMPRAILSPSIRIGVCNVFNSGAGLGHNSECGDFNWFSGRVCTGGNVHIGSRTFLGMCCVISNGVEIADESFVGVCSYVTSNTQKGLAYIGTPAKNTKNMKSKIVIDFV